ncbi:cAMP phosphodiesterases class-II-domain-containing protein [Abortiporus biennis]|nr:cAMP phosphodiesterases class-II-domain-containing protein [Abortiporus biennis]
MIAFDIIVLGCGGGPSEYNLSSYLLKPCDLPWSDGIIGLEAGSGLGALTHLLVKNPDLFGSRNPEDQIGHWKPYSTAEIFSWIQCYLITHAHLDHVNSLVLAAGSLGGPSRKVYASRQTLQDIESIFSDRLWPNLGSWDDNDENAALIYTELHSNNQYRPITAEVSVLTMPVSHGKDQRNRSYDSTAFFIKHEKSSQEFLFFGDVEPDSIAIKPRTLDVWRLAARKIPHALSNIFIECSWPIGRPDDLLYGHLNPEHLSEELSILATEVVKIQQGDLKEGIESNGARIRKKQRLDPLTTLKGALSNVKVYITHCKEDLRGEYDCPVSQIIAAQVQTLADGLGLGVEIIAVDQGMHIRV